MTKVVFEKAFDFHPDADWRVVVEYKPSKEPQTVTRECAEKAIKAGAASQYKEPKGKKDAKRSAAAQDKG